MKRINILDCTLRDGGYYTNWDFDNSVVDAYCKELNELPVEYVEVGYRSPAKKEYLGRFFYLPKLVLQDLRKKLPSKKLVVMLNLKDISVELLPSLIGDLKGQVAMIRIVSAPSEIQEAMKICKAIKLMGFEVGINMMYMSKWSNSDVEKIQNALPNLKEAADILYLVDSYGGVTPEQFRNIIRTLKPLCPVPLGFHGHNNIELALANAIVGLEEGLENFDTTVLGMGRGAGNLKTELFLIYLESADVLKSLNLNAIAQIVNAFTPLQQQYGWGTNVPYMISGSKNLPQKEVMDWMGMKRYDIDNIVVALQGMVAKNSNVQIKPIDNLINKRSFKKAIIIGGGPSVKSHNEAIFEYVSKNPDALLVSSSTHYAGDWLKTGLEQVICLMGNEGKKIDHLDQFMDTKNISFVFPTSPRAMGLYVPEGIQKNCYELDGDCLLKGTPSDAPLSLAMELALRFKVSEIELIGFDGYAHLQGEAVDFDLHSETQKIINAATKIDSVKWKSLTPTHYEGISTSSIYSLL
ncbi:hypothetical protein [Peredibacter starrii]|uniref:Pyruvate carboxyltransferase domain-containing protein n=1 Tax=Peredibacter starrii TaxID=28202 RepID=A0AAX4HRX1_9BACT|nr:hypothetical protein [Peredibacter starrii]WPU65821.1 hypothetical protein SOO65_03580 [Peredibacter starrii]